MVRMLFRSYRCLIQLQHSIEFVLFEWIGQVKTPGRYLSRRYAAAEYLGIHQIEQRLLLLGQGGIPFHFITDGHRQITVQPASRRRRQFGFRPSGAQISGGVRDGEDRTRFRQIGHGIGFLHQLGLGKQGRSAPQGVLCRIVIHKTLVGNRSDPITQLAIHQLKRSLINRGVTGAICLQILTGLLNLSGQRRSKHSAAEQQDRQAA